MKSNSMKPETAPPHVLARHDKLAAVLIQTSVSISESLAQERSLDAALGAAEVGGGDMDRLRSQLADVRIRREDDVRRRRAAITGLLDLSEELRVERAEAARQQGEMATTIVADFRSRWDAACAQLTALRCEAGVLATALRCTIGTPSPYTATISPITGNPELRPVATSPLPEVSLAPAVAEVSGRLDRLDSALGLLAGIRQAAEQDSRHRSLCVVRRVPSEMLGTFEVLRPFTHLTTEYRAGMLVSRDVVGDGGLYRLQIGRTIRQTEAGRPASAA
jgi:hypothetical protein